MTATFAVYTTAHFDRALRKLNRYHPKLADYYERAIVILGEDPYC